MQSVLMNVIVAASLMEFIPESFSVIFFFKIVVESHNFTPKVSNSSGHEPKFSHKLPPK